MCCVPNTLHPTADITLIITNKGLVFSLESSIYYMSLFILRVVLHRDSFVGQQQQSDRSVISAAVEVLLSLRKVHLCTSILVLTPTSILLS